MLWTNKRIVNVEKPERVVVAWAEALRSGRKATLEAALAMAAPAAQLVQAALAARAQLAASSLLPQARNRLTCQ